MALVSIHDEERAEPVARANPAQAGWLILNVRRRHMTVEDFIHAYEEALASQQWALVEPLIHENACVTFSDGTVHVGKTAVRNAYEANFSMIQDEDYRISNVH